MDSKDADVKATKDMIKERHRLVYDITATFGKLQFEYSDLRIYGAQQ